VITPLWRGKGGTGWFPRLESSAKPRATQKKKEARGGNMVSPTGASEASDAA